MEKKQLLKKFKNFIYVAYENDTQLIKIFDKTLNSSKVSLILLNTPESLKEISAKRLSNLCIRKREKIATIESFFEDYLKKCYIPKNCKDFNFLRNIKGYSKFQYFQKRVLDYTGGITLLSVSAAVMLFSCLKIKKQSPGEVIFKQDRVGIYGDEFVCYKFRSMGLDAEKNGIKFATKNDKRVFPYGQTMRKTRIDELPQLWDVMKGKMHFIGPRPERHHWTKQFEQKIPYYNQRHIVAPGITGWAQVHYPYGEDEEDARQKLMYDLYYIKNWSMKLELEVLCKTILVILNRKGV